MTPQRIWLDSTAEREFWRLMQDYETLHPQTVGTGRLWDTLTLAALRRRSATRRLDEIRARAENLVQNHTVPAPVAPPETVVLDDAPRGEATDQLHAILRRAATLANDRGAGQVRKRGQTSGTNGDL